MMIYSRKTLGLVICCLVPILTGCGVAHNTPVPQIPPTVISLPSVTVPTVTQPIIEVPTVEQPTLALTPTPTPTPTLYPAGKGNLIVFESEIMDDVYHDVKERFISVVNVSSHAVARLTPLNVIVQNATWSPDGRYIAYNVFNPLDLGSLSLYFMNANGSNQVFVQKYCGYPVWSPNGLFIACDSQSSSGFGLYSGIYIFDLTKNKKWMVSEDTSGSVVWSPDSQKIAYNSRENGCCDTSNISNIFVQNIEGNKNPTQLTSAKSYSGAFEWSPDGKYILFLSDRTGVSQIYIMNADGTHEYALTDGDKPNFGATWSPDGTKIVFVSLRHEKDLWKCPYTDNPCNSEIYIMNPDGSEQKRLTYSLGEDSQPTWSPDGKHIAFVSFRNEPNVKCEITCNSEIYMMDAEGKNVVRLTNNKIRDFFPVWQPKP